MLMERNERGFTPFAAWLSRRATEARLAGNVEERGGTQSEDVGGLAEGD
jgi:hypothetical protein